MEENMSAVTRRSLFENISRANYFYAGSESFLDFVNLNFTVDLINTQKLIYPQRAASTYMAKPLNNAGEVCDSPCSSEDATSNNGSMDKFTTFETEPDFGCSTDRPLDLSLPSKNRKNPQSFGHSVTDHSLKTSSYKFLKESNLQPITQTLKGRNSAIGDSSGLFSIL